jgi:hypothetical protein
MPARMGFRVELIEAMLGETFAALFLAPLFLLDDRGTVVLLLSSQAHGCKVSLIQRTNQATLKTVNQGRAYYEESATSLYYITDYIFKAAKYMEDVRRSCGK